MKNILFCLTISTLLLACSGNNVKKHENIKQDSLPKAKWNGEYLKIETDEALPLKGKKSISSQYERYGKVAFKLDTSQIVIQLFKQNMNALTFSNQHINAIITGASNNMVEIYLQKDDILKHPQGLYKCSSDKNSSPIRMTISRKINLKKHTYTMVDGSADLLSYDTQSGTFKLKFQGTFKDKNGQSYKSSGTIDMNFITVVRTAPQAI